MNEKLPFVSVVEASTLPEGLINTTTTFAIPTLFASTTRPVILTIERRRDAAARAESSVEVVGGPVGFAGVDSATGGAVGSGDGEGALVGAVFVSVGLVTFPARVVSGVGDLSGFGEVGVGSADAGFSGFGAASVDGEETAVGSGLAFVDAVVGAAAKDAAPILSSRP